MDNSYTIPSRLILSKIEYQSYVMDNDVSGILSQEFGFLPRVAPLQQLPDSHRIWDEASQQLAQLYQENRIREFFDDMPILSADKYALPTRYLQRSATVVGIFAHVYYWLSPITTNTLPESILKPWQTICERLDRYTYFLSYSDLVLHNWQLKDVTNPQLRSTDNLKLLVETINHPAEQLFYLKQVEMAYRVTPIIGAIVRAQEAVVADDVLALKAELLIIVQALKAVINTFNEISSNAYSETYVDPIVWSRAVAPLGVSWRPNVKGPSGTSAPWFHLMDSFITRDNYDSLYGQDQMYYRRMQLAPQISQFIAAVAKISVRDYVEKNRDRQLKGLFNAVVEIYAGNHGLLNLHRYKVYGYLNTAFKIGRMITTGGSHATSPLTNREWVMVNNQLNQSRKERHHLVSVEDNHIVAVKSKKLADDVSEIYFDISQSGQHYSPGDYAVLWVENQAEKIAVTINALNARGDELIELNTQWAHYVQKYYGLSSAPLSMPLSDFLKLTKLRPVQRTMLKKIYRLTQIPLIQEILTLREEDKYEVSDIFELISPYYSLNQLLTARSWENENLSNLLSHETFRYYSIANAPNNSSFPTQIVLCLKKLYYEALLLDGSIVKRDGVMTNYLDALTQQLSELNPISMQFINCNSFSLPNSSSAPIIMIAAGTGIAPFKAFIEQRIQQGINCNCLIYLAVNEENVYYADDFAQYAKQGKLDFHVALTRITADERNESKLIEYHYSVPVNTRASLQGIINDPIISNKLIQWLSPNQDVATAAYFYICGHSGFGKAVFDNILALLSQTLQQQGDENPQQQALNHLAKLIANHHYCTEVFTPFIPNKTVIAGKYQYFHISQIAQHNQANDYWMIINEEVYDITQFIQLHPGGATILRHHAGMDATQAFNDVDHQHNPSIIAQLAMYKIGAVKHLQFAAQSSITIEGEQWQYLSAEQFYQHWQDYLILFLQAENGLRLEMDHFATAPSSAALALLSHNLLQRILPQLLGSMLNQLWIDSVVACRAKLDIHLLTKRAQILLKTSQELADPFSQFILTNNDLPLDVFAKELFAEIDVLLKVTKAEIIAGIMLFEQKPDTILVHAKSSLANHLLAVVARVKEFLQKVDTAVKPR